MGKVKVLISFLVICFLAFIVSLTGCGKPKPPEIVFARSSENLVALMSRTGGPAVWTDYVPCFRLFGDGTVIKRSGNPIYGLLVEGKLSYSEMKELLERIANTGFFNLDGEYINKKVADAETTEIMVNLKTSRKRVLVRGEKVKAFDEVAKIIEDCEVPDEKYHIPKRGFLVVTGLGHGEGSFIPHNSSVYSLLPDLDTLENSISENTPIFISADRFLELKKIEVSQGHIGLDVLVEGKGFRIYPVYEPKL